MTSLTVLELQRNQFRGHSRESISMGAIGNIAVLNYIDLSHNALSQLGTGNVCIGGEIFSDEEQVSDDDGDGAKSMKRAERRKKELLRSSRKKQRQDLFGSSEIGSFDLNGAHLETLLLGNNAPHKGCLGPLTSLLELRLRHNRLATLPRDMGGMGRLRLLDLGHNELVDLPPALGGLTALSHLDVSFNRLSRASTLGLQVRPIHMQSISRTVLPTAPLCLTSLHFFN